MAVRPWHVLSLCDGYGGTELALRSVARVRTVARVERDTYAASVLVARMGEARLDDAPVWDDLATFDGRPWRGRVDIVAAGLPCQPFSAAGQRQGLDDERHLWPDALRIIGEVGCRWVLLENVTDVVRAGWLAHVLADLADLGFDAEWGVLPASAVGAPHRRLRFWLVAHRESDGRVQPARPDVQHGDIARDGTGSDGANVADTSGVGNEPGVGPRPWTGRREQGIEARCRTLAWPPVPDDTDGWNRWITEGGPEPSLRRSTDGRPVGLADALHLGGNGLVPQCAAEAWSQLAHRGGWDLT